MTGRTPLHRPPDELFTLVTDAWTAPFWENAARGVLAAARCDDCGTFRMPPTPFCPSCLSQRIDWTELSGRGTIFSHSAVLRPVIAAMEGAIPYVVAVIELEGAGGCRLISNIVDGFLEDVAIDAPVEVVFDSCSDGCVVPRFKLVQAPA